MPTNTITQLPLRDVHLPDAISWWPLAPGWWITMLVIPMLLWITLWIYQRLTRQTPIKTAKKLLKQLKQDETKTDKQKLIEISALIRRVAISNAPRAECASLTGQAWLEYLDKSVQDKAFTQGVGKCLADISYRKEELTEINMAEIYSLIERWLKLQKNL